MSRQIVQSDNYYSSIYETNHFNYRKNYSKQLKQSEIDPEILALINTNLELISSKNSKNLYIERGVFHLNEESASNSTHQRITEESLKAFADFSYSYLKSHTLKKEEAAFIVDNLEKAIEKLEWETENNTFTTRTLLQKSSRLVLAKEELNVSNENTIKTTGQSLIENKLKSLQTIYQEQTKLQKKIDRNSRYIIARLYMGVTGGSLAAFSPLAIFTLPVLTPILAGVGLSILLFGAGMALLAARKREQYENLLNEKEKECSDPLSKMKKLSSYLTHYHDPHFHSYLSQYSTLLNDEENFYKVHELFRLEKIQASKLEIQKASENKIQKLTREIEELTKTNPLSSNNNENLPYLVRIKPDVANKIEALKAELADEQKFKEKIDNTTRYYVGETAKRKEELNEAIGAIQTY